MAAEKVVERIGLPAGATASVNGQVVSVKAKFESGKALKAKGVSFSVDKNEIVIEARPGTKRMNTVVKTMSAHVRNLIAGAQHNYTYRLAVVFSHFPLNVQVKEKTVEIKNFVGEKFPRVAKIVGSTKVEVKGKEIFVSGPNKDDVGQTAANLETRTRVIGRDNRVYQDGIFVVEKSTGGEKK